MANQNNNPTPASQDDVARFNAVGGQAAPATPASTGDDTARFDAVGQQGQQQDEMDAQAAQDAQAAANQPGFVQRAAQTSGASSLWDLASTVISHIEHPLDYAGQVASQAQSDFQQNLAARDQAVAQLKQGDITGAAKTLVSHLAKRAVSVTPGASILVGLANNTIQHGKAAVQAAEQGDLGGVSENAAEAVPVLGSVGESVAKPLAQDVANKNYSGVAGDIVGPVVAAVVGELAGRGLLGAKAAEATETLPAVSAEDVKAQVVKDAVRKSLGSKADASVVDEAFSRMEPQGIVDKMVSPVENELKLVKPKVAADLKTWNSQLNSVLADSGANVEDAATKLNQTFDGMVNDAKAGVGDAAEAEKSINAVRSRLADKVSDDPTSVTYINQLKRSVGDQIKNFQPPEMLNSAGKAEQEAYRQAYFTLRDMVSDAVPASRDLNLKISRAFDLQDLLEKKFPQLETPEQVSASYKGMRNAGKKALAVKAGKAALYTGGAYEGAHALGILGGK